MEAQSPEPEMVSIQSKDAELHERALELNTDSFLERIEKIAESDPTLASDLRLTLRVADAAQAEGGEALVVGGFVRDDVLSRITGRPITSKDIDLEIYGVEFERLKEILGGFGTINIVGDHFVVAKLHNKETGHDIDCSIPRRDSNAGVGHKGILVDGDPTMSIHEAARRRDFTVNSLALNPRTGEIHDDFGGIEDLKRGILRATDKELFTDDPLRVLRAMQFAGRFELQIEPDTANLCRSVNLAELPRERVGEEWDKLMIKAEHPSLGLEAARQLGILEQLHPDLAILDHTEQEPEWHPEGNVWEHTKRAVDAAARVIREEGLDKKDALVVMYGTLCHDLGKATTTKRIMTASGIERLTSRGHDMAGVEPTRRFLHQVYQENDVIAKVAKIVQGHMFHLRAGELTDGAIRRFARRLEPANVRLYDLVSRSDSNGRGLEWSPTTLSHQVYERAKHLNVDEKPLARVVEGQDFIDHFGLQEGLLLGRAVDMMYELQTDGVFTTHEEAIAYLRDHHNEVMTEAERRKEEMLAAQAEVKRLRKEELTRINKEVKRKKREAREEERLEKEKGS